MNSFVWLILMVIFLLVEAACAVHLVSLWFAAGALVAAIAAMLGGETWLQITLFVVVSGGLLACLWPVTKKLLKPRLTKTNVDAIAGTEGYVTAQIDNLSATGQVKLNGMEWTARSESGALIEVGSLVRVERIEGVKVFVSVVEEKAKV